MVNVSVKVNEILVIEHEFVKIIVINVVVSGLANRLTIFFSVYINQSWKPSCVISSSKTK